MRSEFNPADLDHNISRYFNRRRQSRAHHFLNRASLQCSWLLGSALQLEACERQREMFYVNVPVGFVFFKSRSLSRQ